MDDNIDVRIIQLEPLHVASALGYGTSPEHQAIDKLINWARERGLLDGSEKPRFFGFNNPNPSPGTPNYGYEFWMTVGPEVQPEGEITVKDFEGGLYAVTRCTGGVENIPATWQKLVAWGEASPYTLAHHQWLEEHLSFMDVPETEFVLDLYMPVKK